MDELLFAVVMGGEPKCLVEGSGRRVFWVDDSDDATAASPT